jgi:tellurite methyltransferase
MASSIEFFDAQFQRQVDAGAIELNPFEVAALPYLRGRVLDFGCGLGALSITAARRGCSVLALDASTTAIEHLRQVATQNALPIEAHEADLRNYRLSEDFDTVVSIGLLMFFDCPTALQQLAQLQSRVRPAGTAVINVLVEGTTYLDMFDEQGHCLFARDELRKQFSSWDVLSCEYQDFTAPLNRTKSFVTLIAQKPA